MISVLLYVALIAQPGSSPSTQHRVDRLVEKCAAGKVVRLSAETSNQVAMTVLIVGRAPTRAEDGRFTCVLNGLRTMKDLQFGFVGNEVEP